MLRRLTGFMTGVALCVLPCLADAGVQFDTGGSLRLRYEWKQGFAPGRAGAADPQDYLLSQLRLHAHIHDEDRWGLFAEGQDARLHSAFLRNAVDDTKAANTFADRFDLQRSGSRLMMTPIFPGMGISGMILIRP